MKTLAANPGTNSAEESRQSAGQNVGALRRQTLPAANLGCDESRFGGREPARRSLVRLDAGRTTADGQGEGLLDGCDGVRAAAVVARCFALPTSASSHISPTSGRPKVSCSAELTSSNRHNNQESRDGSQNLTHSHQVPSVKHG